MLCLYAFGRIRVFVVIVEFTGISRVRSCRIRVIIMRRIMYLMCIIRVYMCVSRVLVSCYPSCLFVLCCYLCLSGVSYDCPYYSYSYVYVS